MIIIIKHNIIISIFVSTALFCCCSGSGQLPTGSKCTKQCIPILEGQDITCADTWSSKSYEIPLDITGSFDDMHEVHRQSGYYRTCRFALCCVNKQAHEEHKIATETDDFLSEGMGAQEGEFPHQVYLHMRVAKTGWQCGGTIYNKHHIITANHCMRYILDPDDKTEKEKSFKPHQITVTAGVTDLEEAKRNNKYFVSDIIEHPGYINSSLIGSGFDIAVLRLKGDGLDFSNPKIRSLRIASANFVPDYKRNGLFSGWGVTERNQTIKHLLKSSIPIHHPNTCQRIAVSDGSFFFPSKHHLCAGGADSRLTAGEGDSGGGLICPDKNNRPVHCGVASYKTCARKCIYPTVFTKVSSFTDNFIATATRNETQEEKYFHKAIMGPEIVAEPAPEYLLQIYGEIKDCAAVLVAPQVALTSASCIYDNKLKVTVIHARTRRYIPISETRYDPRYAELKSENVTKLLNDTIRKFDIGYLVLQEKVRINSYPKIGSANWNVGIEYAWPRNGPLLEKRYFQPVPKFKCQHSYKFLQAELNEDQLCVAEIYSGSSSCDRSLGSPLIWGDSLIGIASFRGCKYTFPNVFSDVTYFSGKIKKRIKYYEAQIEQGTKNPRLLDEKPLKPMGFLQYPHFQTL